MQIFAVLFLIQGDQLNMVVFFWYLEKSDLSSVDVYSSLYWWAIFYKVPKKHAMFNWSPCMSHQLWKLNNKYY